MRTIILLTILLFAGCAHGPLRQPAFCSAVIDGDTIIASFGNPAVKERVRMLEIDAPESKRNDKLLRDAARTGEDPESIMKKGKRAQAFLADQIERQEIVLVFPSGELYRDRYGRLLAKIEHEGVDMGTLMLNMEYAEKY